MAGFGVTFALSGVLDMLPFEQRGKTAHRLSVAGNPAWVSARPAIQFAHEKAGFSMAAAAAAIFEHAQLGFLTGRAVLSERFGDAHETLFISAEREWDIPQWV